MLHAIIIDDEKKARENLKNLVLEYCHDVAIIDMCDSVGSGIKAIHKHQPDFIFLDIQMPEENGFDLLRKISPIHFKVIFTTAFDKFAIEAIKFSALDYLLKPINISELVNAVEKVKAMKEDKGLQDKIETLLHNRQFPDFFEKKITLPVLNGFIVVDIKDIIHCQSDNTYSIFYLTNGKKYIVSRTLKECEELLSELDFFRIHQSHMINMNHVRKYNKGSGGMVTMSDNTEIPVSVRKKDEFMKRMPKW